MPMPSPNDTIAAMVGVPAAIAVVATVRLFLAHIAQQRVEDRKERAADRLIWENHLSNTVKVLQVLVDEVRELRRDIK